MSKEVNDRNKSEEEFQNLLAKLMDARMSFEERLARCKTDLTTEGYYPKVPLLENSEKQKDYRAHYISSISAIPEPANLHLEAHELQRRLMETIACKADPTDVKNELGQFFKRRASNLQHKKYKVLIRWAHKVQSSEFIDKVGLQLDPLFSRIQTEYDLAIERSERLTLDDGFHDFPNKADKPHPTATEGKHSGKPLYIESEEREPSSALRQDDIEVYLRVKTFRNQLFRMPNKLLGMMKWMKYQDRFEVLREARRSMMKLRNQHNKHQRELCTEVSDTLREKLVRAGIDTEKVVTAVVDTYTKSLREKEYSSKAEQLMSTTKFDYAKLPLLHTLAIEIKIVLKELSKEFDITGDLEVDNGQSFTYQIQVFFPVLFQKQVENSKFDLYDTFPVDEEGTGQFRGPKTGQLENLESYARAETKKSILGYINTDEIPKITGDISKDTVLKTESNTKLRASYWLPYITFTPTIDPLYKKQSLLFQEQPDHLLASYFDFLDVNDASAVNKILDDASVLHTQRAQKRNPLRDETGKFITIEKEFEQNMNLAVNKEGAQKSLEFEIEPLIEPIPVHIVKGLYMLRYLKARGFKAKLLNAMNYFREIQKRLTCDMLEMNSRDRLNLDCTVLSPKDIQNNSKRLLRKATMNDLLLEALEAESDIDHFVSVKGFKHKKMFKPKVTASSPCLPKLHMAYEGVSKHYPESEEQDEKDSGELPSEKAKRLRGRVCIRELNSDNTDVKIIDEEGTPTMYDTALHDLVSLEEELIKLGTFYIHKQEYMIDVEMREPTSSIDRGAVCTEILEYEHKFQYEKIMLIEQFMKVYEHTCDILEQQRLVQIIADIMAKRPRLNTNATHFIDSYKSEIEFLRNYREFIREIVDAQIRSEKAISNDISEYLELKYRKINEHINKKWEYRKQEHKPDDKFDEEAVHLEEDETGEREREEREKKKRLANIAKRHITDFTKNYDQDFTEVLGLPEITADDLFKNNREKEPVVIDALRQQARFVKIEEGYPYFWKNQDILNFYEGVACVTKVHSLVETIYQEFIDIHKPENGQAYSAINEAVVVFSKTKLKLAKTAVHDKSNTTDEEQTLHDIEDGFICDYPDKMLLLAKEMKSFASNEKSAEIDPFIAGHCNLDTIENFEFVDLNKIEEDPTLNENLTLDALIKKSIQISKAAPKFQSRIRQEEKIRASAKNEEEKMKKIKQLRFRVQMPSLLYFYCNIVEIIRLRENLIKTINETIILSQVYSRQ